MRLVTVATWLGVCAAGEAQAVPTTICPSVWSCIVPAPAPLIGSGIPAVLAVAAVLLGATY